MHETHRDYGASSEKWAPFIAKLAESNNCASILDYGCGKRDLEHGLMQQWRNVPLVKIVSYDPAFDDCHHKEPCELVVSTDMLEHIEPEKLDAVLEDLQEMTLKFAFLVASTIPATKLLEDGRNTHLIVKDFKWWSQKIWSRFDVNQINVTEADVRFLVSRKGHGPIAYPQTQTYSPTS